jgi:selenocysteine lyase/cysteine desulfurase
MALSRAPRLSWEDARRLFPVTERWAYLDHACVSPISLAVHQAMTAHLGDVLADGDVNASRWDRMVEGARRDGATLLGCRPEEVAFLKNTSEGISLVAAGLDWRPGDNVVSAQGEFPTNIYPWMALARCGVELRLVAERDGRIPYRDVRDAIDGHTRVLALSFVEFLSGFRHNVARLGELCRRRGVLFVLDAIQGLGALSLNVSEAGVHFASADAHKWLLGPEGSALFFCRRECLELLGAPMVGWRSVPNSSTYLPYHFTLRPDAARFELGTTNTVGIAGLARAVRLLLAVGLPAIERRIKLLTDRLCRGLARLGADVLSSRRAGEWSGIVSFRLPGADLKAVARRLRQEGIVLSYRLGWLRVSPHFYNSEAEVDRLLEALRGG